MAKNPNGFTKSVGNLEWGSKARKREDHDRGARRKATAEAVSTGLDELVEADDTTNTDDGPEALSWDYGFIYA